MNLISQEQVKHIAKLAKLSIDGEEEKFSSLLSDTLGYIDVLDELDTSGVSPTFQVGALKNVYQSDTEAPTTLTQEESLTNGSEVIDDLFTTRGVFAD
jgi:aspartyl-tRNA(Asn)/glutamyl-tRNA(Gln) amidotransferase subunit C